MGVRAWGLGRASALCGGSGAGGCGGKRGVWCVSGLDVCGQACLRAGQGFVVSHSPRSHMAGMDGEDTSSNDGFQTEQEEEQDEALIHLKQLTCSESLLCMLLANLTEHLRNEDPGVEHVTFTPGDGRLSVDISAWQVLMDLINLVRPDPDWVPLLSSAAVIMSGKKHTDQNLHCDLNRGSFSACGDYHLFTMILPLSASMGFTFEESTTLEYRIGDTHGGLCLRRPYQYVWFSSFDCWHQGLACPSPRLHLVWAKRM